MDMRPLGHGRAMTWLLGIRDGGPDQFLLATGVSIEEVQTMTATNPARLIGLDG